MGGVITYGQVSKTDTHIHRSRLGLEIGLEFEAIRVHECASVS